jgi:hypothetical protein
MKTLKLLSLSFIAIIMAMTISCESYSSLNSEPIVLNRTYTAFIDQFVSSDSLRATYYEWANLDMERKQIESVGFEGKPRGNESYLMLCLEEWHNYGSGYYITSDIYFNVPGRHYPKGYFLMSNGEDPNSPYYKEVQRRYEELLRETGDATFYFETYEPKRLVSVVWPAVKSISITADIDVDAAHPAGTKLDDVVDLFFYDVKAVIGNNYVRPEDSYTVVPLSNCEMNNIYAIRKSKLSEMKWEDYPLTEAYWKFAIHPSLLQAGSKYTFYIEVTLFDGEVKKFATKPVTV